MYPVPKILGQPIRVLPLLVFTMNSTKTSIILKLSKDWPKWIKVTLTAADEFDLRPYVDPRLSEDVLKYLERPIKPALTIINRTNIPETKIPQSNGASTIIAKGSEDNTQGSTLGT